MLRCAIIYTSLVTANRGGDKDVVMDRLITTVSCGASLFYGGLQALNCLVFYEKITLFKLKILQAFRLLGKFLIQIITFGQDT